MTKVPECPICRARMQRTYIQVMTEEHRRMFGPIGWICTNPVCNFHTSD